MDQTNTKISDDSSAQSMPDVLQQSATDSPSGSSMTSSRSRAGTSSSGTGRHRKVPDSVTPNACTNCKKARAKCDGAKPVCRRCNNRSIQGSCQYEIHAKTAKEQMMREIQRLQQQNEHLEEEKDTLGEKNNWIEDIIHSLKVDGQSSEIINRLKRGEPHQAIAEWLGRPLVDKGGPHPVSPTTAHEISEAFVRYHKRVVDEHDPSFWTNVTQDRELIEHLITLYFTWIHPVHMLFDEIRFMDSFRNCADVYCAHSLVSAICAMSCHLLHANDIDDDGFKTVVGSLADEFLEESRFLLKSAEHGKMTTVQTYAVLFLAEFGSGQGLKGAAYLRLATEILVDKQLAEQSAEALSVSAWGVLTLHIAWSAISYQKPTTPVSADVEPFSTEIPHYADGLWRLHRRLDDSDTSERRGFSVMTASQHAKLFQIVHELLLVYCGSRGRVRANQLLEIYGRFLLWKDEVPLELLDGRDNPLPHVLFLLVQYHASIVQMLQPVIHLDNLNRDCYRKLITFVLQHARAGLQLLVRYRDLYSSSYSSPLQLLCLVQLCDIVVRYDSAGPTTSQTMHFCVASLEDAKGGYPLAGPLQMMFRQALADYNIPVPDELERMMGSATSLGTEEMLDACTRATYRQPIKHILPNMDVNMADAFVAGWQQLESRERPERPMPAAAHVNERAQRLDIGSLLNP